MSRRSFRQSRSRSAGFTLIEMTIAVTLVAAIISGLLISMRTGLAAYQRVNQRLDDNRRAMGLDQALHRQLGGMMPESAPCGVGAARIPVFDGTPSWLRFVSSSSLADGARGYPRIIEYLVDLDPRGGVRLMMNERVYSGPASLLPLCANNGFLPVTLNPQSFEMAGRLAYCRFGYRVTAPDFVSGGDWLPVWQAPNLPRAVRIEMAPIDSGPSRLPMLTVNVPVHITRDVLGPYADN